MTWPPFRRGVFHLPACQCQVQDVQRWAWPDGRTHARIDTDLDTGAARHRAAVKRIEDTMPEYRSRTTTAGRNMAGARALWRATGMKDEDFHKPIIAVANSFTQFVPGHVHLKDMGQLVAREIERAGGVAKEFNTIAVDDGIAMGHDGMLYSLP